MLVFPISFSLWIQFFITFAASAGFEASVSDHRSSDLYSRELLNLESVAFERRHLADINADQDQSVRIPLRRRGACLAKVGCLNKVLHTSRPLGTHAPCLPQGETSPRSKGRLRSQVITKSGSRQPDPRQPRRKIIFGPSIRHYEFPKSGAKIVRPSGGRMRVKSIGENGARAQESSNGEQGGQEPNGGPKPSGNRGPSNGSGPNNNGNGEDGGSKPSGGKRPDNGIGPNHDGQGHNGGEKPPRGWRPPPPPPPGGWEYKRGVSEQGEDPSWGEEPYLRGKQPGGK